MTQGIETKYAAHGVKLIPVPIRTQFLKNDYFYPCQRCGDLWPSKKLKKESTTDFWVCPNDHDKPTVDDYQARASSQMYYVRYDVLGQNLERRG